MLTYASFWKILLNFIRLTGKSTYKINYHLGIILLLTRLRLGFSHLLEHKFTRNFADSLDPLYYASSSSMLPNLFATISRRALLTELKKIINASIMALTGNDLLHVFMYWKKKFNRKINISIITATIKFVKDSERFDQPLF